MIIQIYSFDQDFSANDFQICYLERKCVWWDADPQLMFPGRLTDPQLGLQLRLVLPYFHASKLAHYCFMDAGK